MASEQMPRDSDGGPCFGSLHSAEKTTETSVQGNCKHATKIPVGEQSQVGESMVQDQENLTNEEEQKPPTLECDDTARPFQKAFTDMCFCAKTDNISSPFQAYAYNLPNASEQIRTDSGLTAVQRGPGDRLMVTTAANVTTNALLPAMAFNSPLMTEDESSPAVYSVAPISSKTQVISVANHPSQSASVEVINREDQEDCNSNDSNCDNWSYISASTRVDLRKTAGGHSTVPAQQICMPVPESGMPEPASESSFGHKVKHATMTGISEQKVETPSHSLRTEPIAVARTCHEGVRARMCAPSEVFMSQTASKSETAIGENLIDMAASKLPLPKVESLAIEPAATLECHGSPPGPDAVVDPLDSSSSELIEMVCATVNSKWPILARYFSLSEECVAGIKEQDAGAEGRCWVLLLRLSHKSVTWKALYDVLLKKLHLNILACKMAQIAGLPPSDEEAAISRLHHKVIDVHNSTHKVVLVQLSQTVSEHWKKLAEILHFDQCTDVDNVHQILYTSKDADECCCEMLLQWLTWRQAQVKSASPRAHPVTFGELFSYTEAAISGTEMEQVVQAAKRVL